MNGMIVAGELIGGEQLAQLQFHQLEEFRIVHHIGLVHVDDQARHVHLAGEQDVLARLRHRAIGRRYHEDRAIHLRRPGDHILDIVGVSRAVHVGVVAVGRLILHVRGVDRDPTRLLFRRRVNLIIRLHRGLPIAGSTPW